MNILNIYLTIYGLLALSHILIQMLLAHKEHKKQSHPYFIKFHKGFYPSVTVIIPCYNENPEILEKCLESIEEQKYEGKLDTIVIDDGSKTIDSLMPVYRKFRENKKFEVILSDENRGKRDSQKIAFDKSDSEIYVTIDSDTVIETPNGIENIVKQFRNLEVGAVTGDVRVTNKKTNFLTRLISYRYWTAFHQERAAQSLFDVLMCCSGPFSAYRKSVVDKVKEKYVSQKFLGQKCTIGDDRHLTNLVLEEGHKVRFDNRAVAYTQVPENIGTYLKQQVRWNKSFYREMLWTLKSWGKHHWYMIYDMTLQFFLPFMLVIALVATLYQAIFVDINRLWFYIAILIGIALLRATYGMLRTKDIGFLTFVVYGFMHILLLVPARFYALATMGKNGWGTR